MKPILSLLFICFSIHAFSQNASPFVKYGKVNAGHLQTKVYPIDSNAHAVVLSDIGDYVIEGNTKGWFGVRFTRHRVVHILDKSGYAEADVEIPLYAGDGDEEKVQTLRGITYNLENGKVVESKLDRSAIFHQKIDKHRTIDKFTMPNVREGSIIEFEYSVTSDFIGNVNPWLFQGASPTLWSEVNFSVPEFFVYSFLSRGYGAITLNEHKSNTQSFTIRDVREVTGNNSTQFTANVVEHRWGRKDIPRLKEESFTTSIRNHLSRIEFQLDAQVFPLSPRNYRSSWQSLAKGLMESENFGQGLSSSNGWMADEIRPAFASAGNSNQEKARLAFEWVRDHFLCTGSGSIYRGESLKNIMKNKKGSVAEINLLLTAILRNAGLDADPVILSTREHGFAMSAFPMTDLYNYVVVQVQDNGQTWYLDASDPYLGFNQLRANCYNGHARVINQRITALDFSTDSLVDKKQTNIFLSNREKGGWTGSMQQLLGTIESYYVRKQIGEQGRDNFIRKISTAWGTDTKLTDPQIDSLKKLEERVAIKYGFDMDLPADDVIYMNLLFAEGYKKNPFTSADRSYPVEMPHPIDETITVTVEVPQGYEVEELPKQTMVKYDESGASFFEYRINHSGNMISLRCRLKLDRTLYQPDEYELLREFFNFVVTKQSEQVVFKKKK